MKGIYAIKNKLTNFMYVGSSINVNRRFITHKSLLKHNKHTSIYLQRGYNKYGIDNFEFYILEEVLENDLLEIREQYWIDISKNLYNLCKIAGNKSGFKHSKETKLKISNSNKGRKVSEDTKKLLSIINKGKIVSLETRQKLSKSLKGVPKIQTKEFIEKATKRLKPYMVGLPKGFKHSEESKLKMSLSKKGKTQTEESILKRAKSLEKSILQYDKDMNFIKEWDSIKEAANNLNIRRTFISSVLTNVKKSAKGFIFKYNINE